MTRAASPPKRLRAPARREQLLQAATELLVEEGFGSVSVEAVARRAGITRAVIYQHFGDLQTLLAAVIDREMERALSHVSETTPTDLSDGNPRELMLESLEAYLYAVHDHPLTWRLVLVPPQGAPESLRHKIDHGRRRVLARLTQTVHPALDSGDANDAELTARVLSAISDEYARLLLTDPDQYTVERLLHHARWWLEHASFGL